MIDLDRTELQKAAAIELKRRTDAARFLRDPWLFAKYVLADPEHRDLLEPEIHYKGLKFINGPKRRKMILWPRGHLKSTIFTMGESIRRVLLNPNLRIMISSQKVDNSKSYLVGIKKILRDPYFISLYGDLIPPTTEKAYRNNETGLSIFHPKKSKAKEPTFICSGPDAEKTGQHYDLIIHDDVVGRETVSNTQQLEKTYQYYRDSVFLLEPPKPGYPTPEIWIIGTRWHPLDLYGHLINGATDPRCRAVLFEHHVSNCLCVIDVSIRAVKENGKYIWPVVFSDEYLNEMIIADGLDHYSVACQFYNNPADQSTVWFKMKDIEDAKIDASEIATLDAAGRLRWYIAIDPAESTSSQACLSAAVAVGIDIETGIWYVDHADGRKVETPGFLEMSFEAYRRYAPSGIAKFGLESHTKKALAYDLKQRMLETNTLFSIEELKPNKVGDAARTKEMRIKRLMVLFEYKRIRINRNLKDLFDELYFLPSAIHWDLTDALAYVMDLVPPETGYIPKPKRPVRHIQWKAIGY